MSDHNVGVKVRIKAYGKPAETVYFRTFTESVGGPNDALGTVWKGEEIDNEGTLVNRIRIVCEDAIVWHVPVVMHRRYGKFEEV